MASQQQFKDFLGDIEPSSTTTEKAKKAHTGPREFLASHKDFKKYHLKTFLSGSYARDTAIRPRMHDGKEDRADIDVIVQTNHTKDDEPESVINLLYKTIKEKYPTIRKNVRSVTVTTNDFNVDIVPIIAPHGNPPLFIPDRNLKDWVETNPPKHTQWTTDTNEKAGGRFKPLVKLIKWWKREHDTGFKKPKGFVLECMVAECMNYAETQYQELFVGTLEQIVNKYRIFIILGSVPAITDPAVPGNSVTKGIEFKEFKAFYEKAKSHAQIGRSAINEKDPEKETEKWKKIFGDRFPSSKAKTMENLLTTAAISPGLSFPNKPIDPTKKPRGFA
jgi:hypothetical protein